MTEELYAEALTQIAADHERLEKVRRITEGLLYNPEGSELRELGEEFAEAIGMELPEIPLDDDAEDRARDLLIDRQAGVSW